MSNNEDKRVLHAPLQAERVRYFESVDGAFTVVIHDEKVATDIQAHLEAGGEAGFYLSRGNVPMGRVVPEALFIRLGDGIVASASVTPVEPAQPAPEV